MLLSSLFQRNGIIIRRVARDRVQVDPSWSSILCRSLSSINNSHIGKRPVGGIKKHSQTRPVKFDIENLGYQDYDMTYVPPPPTSRQNSRNMILSKLSSTDSVTDRQLYLLENFKSQSSKLSQPLPTDVYNLLTPVISEATTATQFIQLLDCCANLKIETTKFSRERVSFLDTAIQRMLYFCQNSSSVAAATVSIENHLQHEIPPIGAFLLFLRSMRVPLSSLSKPQYANLLKIIDFGFQMNGKELNTTHFEKMLFCVSRIFLPYSSLLPSTKQSILDTILLYGENNINDIDHLTSLMTKLGDMALPFFVREDVPYNVRQEILRWMKNICQDSMKSTKEETAVFRAASNVASVVAAVANMNVPFGKRDTSDLTKLLIDSVDHQVENMDNNLLFPLLHNMGKIKISWHIMSENTKANIRRALQQRIPTISKEHVPLLLAGLAGMQYPLKTIETDFSLMDIVCNYFNDASYKKQDHHHPGSYKLHCFRMLQSMADLGIAWHKIPIMTQKEILRQLCGIWESADSPNDIVTCINRMGAIGMPYFALSENGNLQSLLKTIYWHQKNFTGMDNAHLLAVLGKLQLPWSLLSKTVQTHCMNLALSSLGDMIENTAGHHGGSCAHELSKLLSHVVYGLGKMQVPWEEIPPSLQTMLITGLMQGDSPLDSHFPSHTAMLMEGMAAMHVSWTEDLLLKPDVLEAMAQQLPDNKQRLQVDELPARLNSLVFVSLRKMNANETIATLNSCAQLGISWTDLVHFGGNLHGHVLPRIVTLAKDANAKTLVDLLLTFLCTTVGLPKGVFEDKPMSTNATEDHLTFMETIACLLDVLRTCPDLHSLKSTDVSHVHTCLAYVATLPQGENLLSRTGWDRPETLHRLHRPHPPLTVQNELGKRIVRKLRAVLDYPHIDCGRDLWTKDHRFALSETELIRIVVHSLPHDVHATGNKQVRRTKSHPSSNKLAADNVLGIIELDDCRRWVTRSSTLNMVPEMTLQLKRPRSQSPSPLHTLQSHLYAQYCPTVPIYRSSVQGTLKVRGVSLYDPESVRVSVDHSSSNDPSVTTVTHTTMPGVSMKVKRLRTGHSTDGQQPQQQGREDEEVAALCASADMQQIVSRMRSILQQGGH